MSRIGQLYWDMRSRMDILLGRKQGVRPQSKDYAIAVPLGYQATSLPQNTTHNTPRIAVVCHLFHIQLTEFLFSYLQNIRHPADLYISTDTEQKRDTILKVTGEWTQGKVTVRVVENRGRDIAPKLVAFADIYAQYEFVFFLHSKKDTNAVDGTAWRDYLMSTLIGSPAIVDSVLEIFHCSPKVGIVAPQHIETLRPWINWGDTFEIAEPVAKRMNFQVLPHRMIDFPSGSMFWARTKVLQPMLDLHLTNADFAKEQAQFGGTIAHALERLFYFCAEKAGYTWVKIARPSTAGTPTVIQLRSCTELTKFIQTRTLDLLQLHQNTT